MDSSSGLIIAFVVVVWAAYFIPLALRRYDEASKNASVETTGSLSRVIQRTTRAVAGATGSGSSTSTRPTAAPAEPTSVDAPFAPLATAADSVQAGPVPVIDAPARASRTARRPAPRSADRPAARLAARLAAKRRRRTLLTLLALTAVVGAVAVAGFVPLVSIAAPVVLVVAWLVACRVQVRGERGVARQRGSKVAGLLSIVRRVRVPRPSSLRLPRLAGRDQDAQVSKAAATRKMRQSATSASSAGLEEDTVIVSGQFEDIDPGRKHVMEQVELEADALDDKIVIAVPSVSTAGEALWDPLPVTLPTYVTKPRAGRTVRTIDFSQPHTWTSGHIEGEDVELPKRDDDTGEQRRAVGH